MVTKEEWKARLAFLIEKEDKLFDSNLRKTDRSEFKRRLNSLAGKIDTSRRKSI